MIPTPLPGGRTIYERPSVIDFAEAAGLPTGPLPFEQALLCCACILEGNTEVPAHITLYSGNAVCAQHLPSMVD